MSGRAGEGATFYELLDVPGDASFEEIEASYQRRLAYLDVESLALYSMLDGDEAGRERRSLEEAFRTLSDPERRAAYDRAIGSGARSSYPPLLVPESDSDPSVTQGRVGSAAPAESSPPAPARTAAATSAPAPPRALAPPATPSPPASVSEAASASEAASVAHPSRPPAAAASPASPRPRRLKPDLEIAMKPDTVFDGALLRRLRESANASLQDVADLTKINKRYLVAIEADDYAALPAAVYARGFVCEYAKVLSLDPQLVARSFMALYEKSRSGGVAT